MELHQLPKRRHRLTRQDCVNYVWQMIDFIEPYLPTDSDSLGVIVLSTKVLVQSLGGNLGHPVQQEYSSISISASILKKTLLSRGWCRHHWKQISHSLDFSTAFYLSLLPRTTSKITHSSCSEKVCLAWSSTTMAGPKHSGTCNGCEALSVPYKEIGTIILKGEIPLISISENEDGLHLKWHTWDGYVSLPLHYYTVSPNLSASPHLQQFLMSGPMGLETRKRMNFQYAKSGSFMPFLKDYQ